MSLRNKLFKEMFKMSSAAAQQASTKAPSHKLSCWTQSNPTTKNWKISTQPDPTQPMDKSEARPRWCGDRQKEQFSAPSEPQAVMLTTTQAKAWTRTKD